MKNSELDTIVMGAIEDIKSLVECTEYVLVYVPRTETNDHIISIGKIVDDSVFGVSDVNTVCLKDHGIHITRSITPTLSSYTEQNKITEILDHHIHIFYAEQLERE